MKNINRRFININRAFIAIITAFTFLFTQGGGLSVMGILSDLLYTVEAAEAPLDVKFYNLERLSTTDNIKISFLFTNTSTNDIDLKNLKLRYYYTIDGEYAQTYYNDYAVKNYPESPTPISPTSSFVKMSTTGAKADHYLEIGFNGSSGTLSPGTSVRLDGRFNKNDWSVFNQTNDYSFDSSDSTYASWNRVTAYLSGQLIYGLEPPAPSRESGAWYMFDSTLTNTTDKSKDYTGNYGSATMYGGAYIAPGRTRNGLALDGVDDYANLPTGIVSTLNDFTIATWVKLDTISDWQRIFDFGKDTQVYMHLSPKCPDSANKGVKFAISQYGGWYEQTISSGYELPVGTWKHVAVTLSGTTGILYIDGVEVGRNSNITLRPSDLGSTTNNYIGKSQHADPYLDGMIDDFQIYNRALNPGELKTLLGPVTRINDSDAGIVYSTGWIYDPGRAGSDYQYDIHDFTSPDGDDYFEYTFTGTGINFIAPKFDGNSDAEIYIDGVFQKNAATDGSSNYISQTVTFSKLGLTPGTHTLKVVFYNKTWGIIDALDVMGSNDPPTDITLSDTAIQENTASGTIIANLTTTDINTGDTFVYTLAPGEGSDDNASFGIEGNQLKILTSPNYEAKNSYRIRLRTTDAGGLSYDKTFVITVGNINEAPSLDNPIADQNATEDIAFSFTFAQNTFSDPEGNSITYTAVREDNTSLPAWLAFAPDTRTFSGTPQNSDAGTLNVKVIANDGNSLTSDIFAITVANVNDAPTNISLSNNSIPESTVIGSVVGVLSTTDVDASDFATYSLVAGTGSTDNGSFTIVGNELRTNTSFDYETKSVFSIRVRTTDSAGAYYEKAFSINVTDVNESPTNITLSSASVAENLVSGTLVGTLQSADQDTGNTFTYSLVAGTGATDNGSFSISGNGLNTAAVFNYEVKNSYSIRVRSTDNTGLTVEKVFNITVVNVNEAPSLNALIPDQNAVEDVLFSYQFADGTFSDVDGDTLSYIVTLADGSQLPGWLAFDSASRTFSGTPANNDVGVLNVKVTASDANLTASDSFTLTIANVNDDPTDISLSNSTVSENSASGITVGTLSTVDVDAGDTASYTLVDGLGNTDNGSFTIVGNELRTNGTYDYEVKNSYSIRMRTTDLQGAYHEEIFVINITNVNESPGGLTLSSSNVAENSATGTVVGLFSSTDPDAGDVFTYALVSGTGADDNGAFSITGNQLKAVAVFNFEADNSYSIRVRTTDAGGLSFENTFTISITNVNESPYVVSPIPDQSTLEDALFNFTFDLGTFADIDGNTLSYTASLEDGSALPVWLTFDSGTRSFSGTPTNGNVGVINVKVTATDGSLIATDIFPITVTNVNDAPTGIALSNDSIPENSASYTTVGILTTLDVDAGDYATYTLVESDVYVDNASFIIDENQLKTNNVAFNYDTKNIYSIKILAVDSGNASCEAVFTIRINNSDTNFPPTGISLVDTTIDENDATGVVGILSTQDTDVNDIFSYTLTTGDGSDDNNSFKIEGDKLMTVTQANYEVKNTYLVRIRSTDAAGGYCDAPFVITVNDINEKPVLNSAIADQNASEDAAFSFQFAETTFIDPDGDSILYTAVLEDNSPLPVWLTFNAITRSFSGTPLQNDIGSINVKVTASDGFLSVTDTFTITVVNANDTPADITLSKNSIAENTVSGSTIGVLGTVDEDTGDTFTYTFVSGDGSTDNGSFAISGNELKTSEALNYEVKNTYSIRIRSTDTQLGVYEKIFTINVTNVNEAPTDILLSVSNVAENLAVGTLIGNLSSTDSDLGDTFTYALVTGTGSTDNGSFSISGNQLRTNAVFNYETKNSYSIRLRATDSSGLSCEKVFTISINNVQEDVTLNNVIPDQNTTEDVLFSFQFAASSFNDPDGNLLTYTASLENGSSLPAWLTFTPGTRTFSGTPGDNDVGLLTIKVIADDGSSSVFDTFKITVVNVNDDPTDILISNSAIPENTAANSLIGTLTAIDSDKNDTAAYLLVAGIGDTDNGSFTVVGNELRTNVVFNYETKSNYSIRLSVDDSSGAVYEKVFIINITNVNESPTNISLSPSSVEENLLPGTNVGVLSTDDSDVGDTFSYSFASGVGAEDNGSFAIDGNQLKTADEFNYESKNSYSVRIRTTDALGLSHEKYFTILINDINEKPVLENQLPDQNAAEGVLFSFQFAANTFTDPDEDLLSYSALLGNNNPLPAWLTFEQETRTLRGTPSNGDVGTWSVRITASDGSLTESDTFIISVANVNNSPTDIKLSNTSIPENVSVGTTVGTLSTADLDMGDTFSYVFVSGNGSDDNSSFSINGNEFKIAALFDYEIKNSFTIRVRTTDAGGLFYDKALIINIMNVDEGDGDTVTPSPTPSAPPIMPPPVIMPEPSPVIDAGSTLLTNLTFSKGVLTPVFKAEEKVYTLNLEKDVYNTNVIPFVKDENSTIKVNGKSAASGSAAQVELKTDSGVIEIEVTAVDGITKSVYTIRFARILSKDAYLSGLMVLGIELNPSFDPETLNYKSNVDNNMRVICIVPYTSSKYASITLNGSSVLSGKISYAVVLEEGENKLAVQVTAEDKVTIRTYSVTLYVEALPSPTPTPLPTPSPSPTQDDSKPFFSSIEDLLNKNNLSTKTGSGSENTSDMTKDEDTGSLFADVPSGYWAEDYIRKLYDRGIIKGIDKENFKPGRPITRAEFTQIIVNSLNIPYRDIEPLFEDVRENDWYNKPVSAAAKFGIIVGRPDGSFAPNESITRQDMAVVIAKFLEKRNSESGDVLRQSITFLDKDNISEYAFEPVSVVVSNGLMVGKPGNVFDPKGLTTRAEAVTVICRLLRF